MEDCNWETIFTDYIGLYSTTVMCLASKEMEIGEKMQNKGYYAVQGHPVHRGQYQSKARMRQCNTSASALPGGADVTRSKFDNQSYILKTGYRFESGKPAYWLPF